MRSPLLRRYWFRFERSEKPTPLNLGCGVTAFDYEDALLLVREILFKSYDKQRITECIENPDVSQLDAGHVLPNLGDVTVRGIWFPLL